MNHFVILAQSKQTAAALKIWLTTMGPQPSLVDDVGCIIFDPAANHQDGVAAFEAVAQALSQEVSANFRRGSGNIVVLVDSIRPEYLNAIGEQSTWEHLIAMLILSFPDVGWRFAIVQGPTIEKKGSGESESPSRDSLTLFSLLGEPARTPWFDSATLRNWVRAQTNEGLKVLQGGQELPLRNHKAAAIDDEISYAYLHAYLAYRFGYRSDAVDSWALMKHLFNDEKNGHDYRVLLEDMSLQFPDKPAKTKLFDLKHRGAACKALDSTKSDLEKSVYRIIITTGESAATESTARDNAEYLRSNKPKGHARIVPKPASGMFGLWQSAGLYFASTGDSGVGYAPDFQWPPEPKITNDLGEKAPHGAPGKVLLIAEWLLTRARSILDDSPGFTDIIRGAVMATDALELTGLRTPTVAVEALRLKHQFEVLAECKFSGVEYHIPIEERLKEIRRDVYAISRWFGRKKRREASMNAQMAILTSLVRVFREHGQFDEEQQCMARMRRLHNALWVRQAPTRWLFYPFLRYLEALLSSFSRFALILLGWIVLLALLFGLESGSLSGAWGPLCGFQDAFSAFFTPGEPVRASICKGAAPEWLGGYRALISSLAIFTGSVHMGVFIAHVYTISSRR